MGERIDLSERLFNLTCALLVAKNGLSKSEIFATVQGYKESYKPDSDNSALNRMFERDKVLLTEAGVAWQSFIPKEAMEDNQEYRYLIENRDFVWPREFMPNARQLALMNLAAKAWAKASLSQAAQHAIVRLRAMGESAASSDLIGIAPTIRTKELSFEPIAEAIEQRQVICFEYRKPDSAAELRTVSPWAIRNISGQWLMIGFDHQRSAPRNYLLRRITTKPKPLAQEYISGGDQGLSNALDDLAKVVAGNVARITVLPDSGAWFHFALGQGETVAQLSYLDLHLLADDLIGFADELVAIEPAALSAIVRSRLEQMLAKHG